MIINLPTPDRDPGPYERKRPCGTCGAFLLTTNPGPTCAPCELTTIGREVDNVFELRPRDAA